jgi:hypothetical protein
VIHPHLSMTARWIVMADDSATITQWGAEVRGHLENC